MLPTEIKFRHLLLGTVSALSIQPVVAQDTAQGTGLEEIVVTAQRREERMQDVPIAITSVTAASLEAAGARGMANMEVVTPGLVMPRSLKGSTAYLRGVGTTTIAPGVESPIATYVDGIYYMSSNGNIFEFNNVERVEVLKGPQGTLFGRNATGGLVNVITRDPSAEPAFEGDVRYGKYETAEASLYATGGNDVIAADIALRGKHMGEGFGEYVYFPGEDANYERNWGATSKVLFTPNDTDRLTLAFDFTKDTGEIGTNTALSPGLFANPALGAITRVGGDYDPQAGAVSKADSKYYGASLRWVHEFDTITLTSTTAYRKLDYQVYFDLDKTNSTVGGVDALSPEDSRTFQQEFLLSGSWDRLSYTLGAFYFNANAKQDRLITESYSPTAPLPNGTLVTTYAAQTTDSYAVFAQGTYAVTDTTNVTAGARYTIDDRDFNATTTLPAFTTIQSKDWAKPTWRLALDQKLGDNVLAYVSYDRGFKSGAFNTGSITQPPVNPEVLDAYQIGLKTELFDRTVRLNVAAFYYDYKDIQLSRVQPNAAGVQTQVLVNAAEATIKGGEVEFEWAPQIGFGDLSLSAGVSAMQGEYDSFPNAPSDVALPGTCAAPNATPTGGFRSCPADMSGSDTIRTPELTYNIGARYNFPVANLGELGLSVNYYYNDGFFWNPDNTLVQPSYNILNAQIGFAFGSDQQYRVYAYGNNLTDDRYFLARVRNTYDESGVLAPPMTWGAGLSFKF